MICNFTFKHYEEILKLAVKNRYHFLLFQESSEKYKKIIYLRHDIDISPANAINFAKIENKYGIKATYFYLLHDIFYNILEKKNLEDIKKIYGLGHQIGLHFDRGFSVNGKNKLDNLTGTINKELNLFRKILGMGVNVVSFHNPSPPLFKKRIEDKKFINVYSKKYFGKIKYISDSLQIWREKCLCKIFKEEKYDKMQVLIHPFCWSKKSLHISRVANDYIFQKCRKMNEYLKSYSKVYRRKGISKSQCPLHHK